MYDQDQGLTGRYHNTTLQINKIIQASGASKARIHKLETKESAEATISEYRHKLNKFALRSDRGKGVPSFDEKVAIVLEEVDFDDPTTNVRGRRALAIAKPTPRGYRPRRSTINLTTRVCFLRANEEQARN